MTSEQWLIYLYSVWPIDWIRALLIVWTIITLALTFAWWVSDAKEEQLKDKTEEGRRAYRRFERIIFSFKYSIPLLILLAFVPNRNEMLAIIAAPYAVESIKDAEGKVMKINKLIDMSLDKAIKELKQENTNGKL